MRQQGPAAMDCRPLLCPPLCQTSVVVLEPGLAPAEVGLAPPILDRRDRRLGERALAVDVVGDELSATDRDHDVAGAAAAPTEEGEPTCGHGPVTGVLVVRRDL